MAGDHTKAPKDLYRIVYNPLRGFGSVQLGHRRLATNPVGGAIPGPGRTVDEQRTRVYPQGHVGELALYHLQLAHRRAEQVTLRGALQRLVERPAGEPQSGRSHRRSKHVQRRHGYLEALAGLAKEVALRHPAVVELERRQGVRRDRGDAFQHPEARRLGIHNKGAQALGSRLLTSSREDGVEVRQATVGDPGLRTVYGVVVAVLYRGGGYGGDVGAGLRLGEREGGYLFAPAHPGQVLALLLLRPEERDWAASQPLHGEGEVGEPMIASQGLAQQAQRAHVEGLVSTTRLGWHGIIKPAGAGETFDQLATRLVHGPLASLGYRGNMLRRPRVQVARKRAVLDVEERPAEKALVGHQSPSKSGCRFSIKARSARSKSRVCIHIACACASDSIAASSPIFHSWLSMVLVMPWAKLGPPARALASSVA